ncbi:MAG: GyrI-like domain-containing protein [Dehalococcoidia bacterium]
MQALYGVSYTLKFMLKKRGGPEFRVMPLEALWWNDAGGRLDLTSKADWSWTAMLRQPDFAEATAIDEASAQAKAKRELPALAKMRFEKFCEGLSAQIMHVGPYAAEAPTIEKLHAFIAEQGYEPSGKHHEIYLGDPRRSAPEKLKTVVRQPIRRP